MSGRPWRGSHETIGLLLGGPGVGHTETRRRALALLDPGVRLFAIDDPARILVTFATPRRFRGETAPGALVVAIDRRLCAADIDTAWLAAHTPPGVLVLSVAGSLASIELDATREIQPQQWLDVGAIELVEGVALASPPAAATLAIVPPVDARAALGDAIPERAPGAQQAAAALAALMHGRAQEGDASASALPLGPAATPARVLARALVTALAPLLWLASQLVPRAAGSSGEGHGEALTSAPPSWVAHLRALASRWLLTTRLGAFLQRRQAEYLRRLFALFDGDDIEQILRWAIPLGGDPVSGVAQPALTAPGPRTSLAIPLHRQPGPVIDFGAQVQAMLRARYEQLFTRLQREERIDEAAYVRAELLGDLAGAIAFLERHGRVGQAARLAEARHLPADQIVRLWTLARDIDRALAIGRREGVLPQAIATLRAVRPEAAATLALRWAELLADAGEHAAAAQAVRGIAGAEGLERAWVALAIEAGGVSGARMLARRAAIDPDAWSDVRARAEELLMEVAPERRPERVALAGALAAEQPEPAVSALRALCARSLLVHDPGHDDLARAIASSSADVVLMRDLPRGKRASTPAGDSMHVRVPADDVGGIAVHDAALLPDGRTLVALGEAGLRLYGRDGRLRASIAAPATALVVSDTGTRALALVRRGGLVRIARVDLQSHRQQSFWEAPLGAWADSFDGDRWLVVERGIALAIDVTADTWSALWRQSASDTNHASFTDARRVGGEWVLHSVDSSDDPSAEHLQRWTFDERRARLRAVSAVPSIAGLVPEISGPSSPSGWWPFVREDRESGDETPVLARDSPRQEIVIGDEPHGNVASDGTNTAATALEEGGLRVTVVANTARVVARVHLDGAADAHVRVAHGIVMVCDDRGRVIALDPPAGAVIRDLRIQP